MDDRLVLGALLGTSIVLLSQMASVTQPLVPPLEYSAIALATSVPLLVFAITADLFDKLAKWRYYSVATLGAASFIVGFVCFIAHLHERAVIGFAAAFVIGGLIIAREKN